MVVLALVQAESARLIARYPQMILVTILVRVGHGKYCPRGE
jgi:hypothetical protein